MAGRSVSPLGPHASISARTAHAGAPICSAWFTAIRRSTQLVEDTVVFVKGRLDKREDIPRLVAMEMQVPDLSSAGTNAPVVLTIPTVRITPPMVARLGEVLSNHRGNTEVRIKLQGPRKTTVLWLDRHRVQPDPALFGDLKVLLGPSCLAG